MNRPPERCCNVQADIAVTVGLRGNAIATDVASPMRVVRRCAECEQLVRIPLRLLDEHGVESERLRLGGARRERRRVEGYVRLTEPRIELAQRQQRLDLHEPSLLDGVGLDRFGPDGVGTATVA